MIPKKLSYVFTSAVIASAMVLSPSIVRPFAPATALAASVDSARWIGVYEPGAPQNIAPLAAVEAKLGTHVEVANFFRSVEQDFTDRDVENVANRGSIPLITLEICNEYKSSDVTQSDYSLKTIVAGSQDAVLRKYARDARDCGHEIWIRPFHEMNGYWYPWSGTTNGNTPAEFIAAWRHVHDVFQQEGATKVKFVWCPNIESLHKDSSGKIVMDREDGSGGNRIANYYPGDAYVDYLALDGYNPSSTLGLKWRSFSSLFAEPYDVLCSLSPEKPIFIAETASVSVGGDKPAWIADMFRVIPTPRFHRIVGVSWYNADSSSPRQDWRVDSSGAALQAFRLGVANGSYAPGLQLTRVRTGISIKQSAKKIKRRRKIKLSGVLSPGQYHDRLRVNVSLPKHRHSHRNVLANGSAGWSMSYTPTKRGTYYVTVSYAGDSTRFAGASKRIKFVVK